MSYDYDENKDPKGSFIAYISFLMIIAAFIAVIVSVS